MAGKDTGSSGSLKYGRATLEEEWSCGREGYDVEFKAYT